MATNTSNTNKAEGRVLLPSTFLPIRYDLKIKPDLSSFTFDGEVKIQLKVDKEALEKNPTNEICMHAKELSFISAELLCTSGGTDTHIMDAEEFRMNTKTKTITFCFPNNIKTSDGDDSSLVISIKYTGFLNNQMAGFYRSSYTDIHGNSKIMASTQFESLDARRAFPCWDEPSRKAIFGVTLVIPSLLTCFSNMPESSCHTLEGGKFKECKFFDSPLMSTYLLAFVVGEFDYVQDITDKDGVLIKVYTPPGKSHTGVYALECAEKSLDLYNDFFGINYPLPKLDMVAIPEFAAGAMENWGLVTYREVDLLIDPLKASSSQKQRVCTVVTHELAHQWFGNLVTMEWWDDLWLNEGFASWAENYAADALFPEWMMWDQFTTGHLSAALRLDALKSSHPIQVPIHHAEEVEEVFDAISYCKGGSVVRMIKAVLGMKDFQRGLSNYMKQHAYSNTETFDLWKAWEDVSGIPVQDTMRSWTEQMGFPLVKVVDESWSDDKVTLTLEQQWFLSDGSELTDDEQKKIWSIPILSCTANGGTQSDMTFMREKKATITIPLTSGKDEWVKLNAGQEVPMRVLPTPTMLERLDVGIKTKALPARDRAGLLNDSYALVKANMIKPETFIKLLSSYTNEDSYIVWQGLSDVLNGFDTVTSDDEQMNANFVKLARRIVLNLVKTVGWEAQTTDGHLTTLLRGIMIGLLSKFCYDDPDVSKEAKTRFDAFTADHNDVQSLPSDMRAAVFQIVLKNGSDKEYNEVKSYFYAATDNAERKHVLASLGSTLDPKLKLQTMEWTTSGEVKLQDFFYAMGSVGRSSRVGRDVSWTFFQNNFDKIKGMIGKGSPSLMDACIVCCAGSFCSNEKATEIESFFKNHPLPSSARKIAQTVESMKANAKFLNILQSSELSNDAFWSAL